MKKFIPWENLSSNNVLLYLQFISYIIFLIILVVTKKMYNKKSCENEVKIKQICFESAVIIGSVQYALYFYWYIALVLGIISQYLVYQGWKYIYYETKKKWGENVKKEECFYNWKRDIILSVGISTAMISILNYIFEWGYLL